MIHELRICHAALGRLPDLLKRFDSITLKTGLSMQRLFATGADGNRGSTPSQSIELKAPTMPSSGLKEFDRIP